MYAGCLRLVPFEPIEQEIGKKGRKEGKARVGTRRFGPDVYGLETHDVVGIECNWIDRGFAVKHTPHVVERCTRKMRQIVLRWPGDMRREEHVGQRPEGMIERKRLRVCDIDGREESACLQGFSQGLCVDKSPPRCIDKDGIGPQ